MDVKPANAKATDTMYKEEPHGQPPHNSAHRAKLPARFVGTVLAICDRHAGLRWRRRDHRCNAMLRAVSEGSYEAEWLKEAE